MEPGKTSVRFNNGRNEFHNTAPDGPLCVMAFQQTDGAAHPAARLWKNGSEQTATGSSSPANTFSPRDDGIMAGCGGVPDGTGITEKFRGTIGEVLVPARDGTQIPLVQLADIR